MANPWLRSPPMTSFEESCGQQELTNLPFDAVETEVNSMWFNRYRWCAVGATVFLLLEFASFWNEELPTPEQTVLVMGTGSDVFIPLRSSTASAHHRSQKGSLRGRRMYGTPQKATDPPLEGEYLKQKNMDLDLAMNAHADWSAAGRRGTFLGTVKAPQVDALVEKAAADCGSDPNCLCDWAGTPHKCLFAYCCGTIIHNLGQSRPDYQTELPSPEQLVDAANQARHLAAWQAVCQPEQTYFSSRCSRHAVPAADNRKF